MQGTKGIGLLPGLPNSSAHNPLIQKDSIATQGNALIALQPSSTQSPAAPRVRSHRIPASGPSRIWSSFILGCDFHLLLCFGDTEKVLSWTHNSFMTLSLCSRQPSLPFLSSSAPSSSLQQLKYYFL